VSFATVWRVADRAGIELTAGREAKGYKRLPADQWRKIADTITKNPKATQEQVARATGVSRSTVGRIKRGDRLLGD
jgi:transcriptional regulator with XRE-family HTH domain